MHKLHLPRLGQTMERGTLAVWLKREGEAFETGEPLYEVETEKVTVMVEAKLPGTLARVVVPLGEEIEVGTLIAVVADPGERLSEDDLESAIAEEGVAAPTPPVVEAPERSGERVRAMPRARTVAKELGIDLSRIAGTGRDGAITVEDVEREAGTGNAGPRVRERRPVRGIAKTMAQNVSRSWSEIPQFVQQVTVDASSLARRRESEGSLSFTDLVLEGVVRAVREVPDVNATFTGDELVIYEDVNLSVAVATEAGLIVPVIRRGQELSLPELAGRLRDLAERARAGTLGPEDVEGGTITISNLGMFGIETGVPLVAYPQAAIVFAGSVVERPVAIDGAIEVRPLLGLAVAFDHRAVDGVRAASFTQALKRALESL